MAARWTAADRQVVRLAVPALGALVAEPIFLLVDSAFVGRLGPTPQAALAVAGVIVATVVSLAIFLAYGTTGQVARRMGAGQVAGAVRAGLDACWLAAFLGIASAAVLLVLAPRLVSSLSPPLDVVGPAVTYVRVSAMGLPGMLVVLAGFGVLRGMLDTVTPLRVAVGGALANVVLNWVLIYPVGLGLAGAAAGTAIAQTAMAWVLVRRVLREASQCDVTWRPDLGGVLSSGRAGVPLLVRTAAMRVTLLVATAVAADMGTSALAAHQVAFVVWTLLAMILDALAIAAQAMVGTSLGAGDVDATRRLGRRLIGWGVLSGATLGAALLLLRYPVALLVTTDPGVRDLIVASLAVAALLQPMAGLVFALDGVLIGAGDNLYLAGAAALATGVFVPLALATQMLTTGADGLVWLWWAIGGWMLVRAVTLSVRVYGERWLVPGAAASSDPRK